jgi:hypothetical protein
MGDDEEQGVFSISLTFYVSRFKENYHGHPRS